MTFVKSLVKHTLDVFNGILVLFLCRLFCGIPVLFIRRNKLRRFLFVVFIMFVLFILRCFFSVLFSVSRFFAYIAVIVKKVFFIIAHCCFPFIVSVRCRR